MDLLTAKIIVQVYAIIIRQMKIKMESVMHAIIVRLQKILIKWIAIQMEKAMPVKKLHVVLYHQPISIRRRSMKQYQETQKSKSINYSFIGISLMFIIFSLGGPCNEKLIEGAVEETILEDH